MIWLDRPARDALAVSDPVDALLTLGTEIEMILQQHAQQLPPVTRKPGLQIRMLNTIRRSLPSQSRITRTARENEQTRPLARS